MSVLPNVVTVSSSGSIPNNQRVTLVGASSLTLTLPINDGTTLSANTRFVVVIPSGLGITGTVLNTSDGTLFDPSNSTTLSLTAEGQYDLCINNGRWYVQLNSISVGSNVRYLHINVVDWTTSLTVSTYRSMVGLHSDFNGWTLESISYIVHTVGGRGTTTIELGKNGVFSGVFAILNDSEKCVTRRYGIDHTTCDDYVWRITTLQSAAPIGLSVDMKFVI